MITNNEFVSRVVNNLKGLSKDAHISKRFILSTGRTKSKFLMSQKLDELTMFREEDCITTIPCFELERIDYKSCDIFEFRLCDKLMRSKHKLPEGFFGKNGAGIVSVTPVDEHTRYNFISPNQYIDLKKRKYARDTTKYFYVKDGYLYLPDSTVEVVDIRMFTIYRDQALSLCACNPEHKCKSAWDQEFICPDRFLDLIIKDTLTELGSIYRTSLEDANPNLDVNQKTQTEV